MADNLNTLTLPKIHASASRRKVLAAGLAGLAAAAVPAFAAPAIDKDQDLWLARWQRYVHADDVDSEAYHQVGEAQLLFRKSPTVAHREGLRIAEATHAKADKVCCEAEMAISKLPADCLAAVAVKLALWRRFNLDDLKNPDLPQQAALTALQGASAMLGVPMDTWRIARLEDET